MSAELEKQARRDAERALREGKARIKSLSAYREQARENLRTWKAIAVETAESLDEAEAECQELENELEAQQRRHTWQVALASLVSTALGVLIGGAVA